MVSRRPGNLLRWPAALFEQSYNHSDFNYVFEQRQSSAECSIKKHTHTAYKCLPSHSLYIAIPHRDYSSVCGDLRIADLCNCHPWLMQSSMNTLTQLALDWMPKANSCEVRDVYSGAFFCVSLFRSAGRWSIHGQIVPLSFKWHSIWWCSLLFNWQINSMTYCLIDAHKIDNYSAMWSIGFLLLFQMHSKSGCSFHFQVECQLVACVLFFRSPPAMIVVGNGKWPSWTRNEPKISIKWVKRKVKCILHVIEWRLPLQNGVFSYTLIAVGIEM